MIPGPRFKWPVGHQETLAASSEEVWHTISTPGNLETCHPFVSKNPVISWPGIQSVDQVHYLNGLVFERRFCGWTEGKGYQLKIGEVGKAVSHVSWEILACGPHESVLRIVVYPHLLQDIPDWLRWAPSYGYIRPMLKKYLRSVLNGFKWYLDKGEAVPRNHFGHHPWFSKPQRKPGPL